MLLTVILTALCITQAMAAEKPAIIWECSQNVPNSAYWRMYASELEEMLPFDGVMLKFEYPVTKEGTLNVSHRDQVGWKVFGKEKLTTEMTKPFVKNMKAANLKKLDRNLVNVWLDSHPRALNYFDDDWWKIICDNMRLVAKGTKDAGCVGFALDPEQYGGDRCFGYKTLLNWLKIDKPYEEYVAKVRQRGREFGKALSEGFPDATLLFFHSYSWPADEYKRAVREGRATKL